jgi:hypothetical protein
MRRRATQAGRGLLFENVPQRHRRVRKSVNAEREKGGSRRIKWKKLQDSRVQYRLKLTFGKVCNDHRVHVPNLQLAPIRLANEMMMHALLQLAVLHRAAVEYFGQKI